MAKIAAAKHAAATARPTLSKEELRTKVVAVAMAPMAPGAVCETVGCGRRRKPAHAAARISSEPCFFVVQNVWLRTRVVAEATSCAPSRPLFALLSLLLGATHPE